MTVDIPIGAEQWVAWRHFNHADNAGVTTLRQVAPTPEVLASSAKWPGDHGVLAPRGSAWTCTLDLQGTPTQHALHILDTYTPGPPANHENQYLDPVELASMTSLAWRIRWECPWQGGGSADFNDVYTYLWVAQAGAAGEGWTVGHIGVFTPPGPD